MTFLLFFSLIIDLPFKFLWKDIGAAHVCRPNVFGFLAVISLY